MGPNVRTGHRAVAEGNFDVIPPSEALSSVPCVPRNPVTARPTGPTPVAYRA